MTDYFVDSTTGSDLDDGTTMDLAWATLEHAMGSGGLAAGDTVWVRRVHDETPTADIAVGYAGTSAAPIRVIGWPRATDASITSATWTNGSKTVDLVVGLSMDREKHVARYIVAPDGTTYMIAVIDDANTFRLLNEYAGPTVTGASGACTIQEDTDYDEAQAIDDSGWTITVATWTADADDLSKFGFDTGAYSINFNNDDHWEMKNLWFIDSADGNGIIYVAYICHIYFEGCIIENSKSNRTPVSSYLSSLVFRRCFLDRTSGGNTGTLFVNGLFTSIRDCVFYSSDGYSLYCGAYVTLVVLDNVWLDVVGDSVNDDLFVTYGGEIRSKNTLFTGNISPIERNSAMPTWILNSENHNQVLGGHKVWNALGTITKTDVVAGSGDPYKRTNGADSVMEIKYDQAVGGHTLAKDQEYNLDPVQVVLTHEFEATVDRRRYRYYVQAEGAVLASELWMEVEYVSSYGDATTEYVVKRLTSDEAITQRVDASDWSQYIEVDNITPALASKVRVKVYCSYYHATNKIYIDPLPEVTV
ncbi:MAG: hypothetical protein ACYTBJ_22055 [Planctomycetota bacterium]